MKAIPLGLISSIIFSIVLAENYTDSLPTTCCFPFCSKKTKKIRKTIYDPVKVKGKGTYDPDIPNIKFIDEFDPIILEVYKGHQSGLAEPFTSETDGTTIDKVTGFLRRENDSRRQGWYIRPYEEEYENMIKVNFVPFKGIIQPFQYSSNSPLLAISETPEKHKSSTLHEDAELDGENDEIYEKNKHLLCINPEETIKASEVMDDAVEHFKHHAICADGYEPIAIYFRSTAFFFKKKHEGHIFEKIVKRIYNLDTYNIIINKIWNSDNDYILNPFFSKKKIVRVYSPNLAIIQQRYKNWYLDRQKYFYALVKKVRISENETVIVMASANINDHNSKDTKSYQNTVIEKANLFKTDIDSEDDIRKGKLRKTFVNIAGFLIEKKNKYVDVTFIASVSNIQILII
ncbi:fam-a protein [Plasmodium vinckei brucechwatti]|uniref:Fam-a protein n=1 Tax=Plasmodium vinckei brucechwatti TaxID=119398 RepID=A0A6V7T1R1_PLAVN|nr:fam-a protein [Plasmodium vinckei brucechwatti]